MRSRTWDTCGLWERFKAAADVFTGSLLLMLAVGTSRNGVF